MSSVTPVAALNCAGRVLDLSTPTIMAVINVTPDSFSDGGRWLENERPALDAIRREASAMTEAGAALLDVGGESTRPGADSVSLQAELDRVLPVVEALAGDNDAIISVDTSRPAVMRAAVDAGAGLINDVRALRLDGALEAVADLDVPVCLMHMQGSPETMQADPQYGNVVDDVVSFLRDRVEVCANAGIDSAKVLLDPGFGFGKSVAHNLRLLASLPELARLGQPLLVGLSRKSLIAKLTGRAVDERLPGSLALALLAVQQGAAVLRVHDVAETADVLRILRAFQEFTQK